MSEKSKGKTKKFTSISGFDFIKKFNFKNILHPNNTQQHLVKSKTGFLSSFYPKNTIPR